MRSWSPRCSAAALGVPQLNRKALSVAGTIDSACGLGLPSLRVAGVLPLFVSKVEHRVRNNGKRRRMINASLQEPWAHIYYAELGRGPCVLTRGLRGPTPRQQR